MKKLFLILIAAGILAGNSTVFAVPVTITDNYIGAAATHPSWAAKDIIGRPLLFDVSKIKVNFNAGSLSVDIYTRYLNNIGKYGTQLGDLFVSTDGWNPFGAAPYTADNYLNGEDWEYALVLDNHLPDDTSGLINLYQITDPGSQIILSNANGIYREGQEVQFDTAGLSSIAAGTWSLENLGGVVDTDDYLRFVISDDYFHGNLGFHWAMTCGNDVIEGGEVHAPEPATLFLLGSGMIGLGWFGRKKMEKK